MIAGETITAKRLDPANAIFRVIERSRNGWLSCACVGDLRGRIAEPYGNFKFRVSEMTTGVEGQRDQLSKEAK